MNTIDSVDPDLPFLDRLPRQTTCARIAETVERPPRMDEVHAWMFPLHAPDTDVDWCARVLDSTESQRAARFHFDKHRRRFIIAHAVMRQILAPMVDRRPGDWTWQTSTRGKPYLPEAINSSDLHFNLSHSGETGFLAVRRKLEIGADIEQIREMKDASALANSYYSTAENEYLRKLNLSHRNDEFFTFWTRKEAFLKATGDGLAGGLSKYCTAGSPGVDRGPVRSAAENTTLSWAFFDCPAPHGFRAAIVTDPTLRRIAVHHLAWRT